MVTFNPEQITKVLSKIFPNVNLSNVTPQGYVMVNCPFKSHGGDYNASAGLNPVDGFFNCLGCQEGHELQFNTFIKRLYNLKNDTELKNFVENISNAKSVDMNAIVYQHQQFMNDLMLHINLSRYGITDNVLDDVLMLKSNHPDYKYMLPIFMDGDLLGYKYYTDTPINDKPKSIVSKGLHNGIIIPFDLWKNDQRPTLICEGEKDMLVARSNGFNAITLTGGSKALPKGWIPYLQDKEVWIVYDNDKAGKEGGEQLANYLFINGVTKVKNVTNWHHELNEKEDITDWFHKYQYTTLQLLEFINKTPYWTQEDVNKTNKFNEYKEIDLGFASDSRYIDRWVQSVVQVSMQVVTQTTIKKHWLAIFESPDGEEQTAPFEINEDCMELYWLLKEPLPKTKNGLISRYVRYALAQQYDGYENLKTSKFVGYTENYDYRDQIIVWVSEVQPYVETQQVLTETDEQARANATYRVYTFDTPLDTSKVYRITYKPVGNPVEKNVIQLLCREAEQAGLSINNFQVSETTKQALDKFQAIDLNAKINELYWDIKSNYINHLNFDLWLATELTFNSVLEFKLKNKPYRGTVYANFIGDTRSGKSEIVRTMCNIYQQGKVINTKLSSVDSLTGGTQYSGKEMYIRAGLFPSNHRGLLALEELQRLGNDYFTKVTEVKSSGLLNINRVSGSLTLPCTLRLIEISNPKKDENNSGSANSVEQFANAYAMIKNLIREPEDIARNDIYVSVVRGELISPWETMNNPFMNNAKIPVEFYQERIRWAWSRKASQIEFEQEQYLWEASKKLMDLFDCSTIIMSGPETYQRLGRLAIALAIMTGSHRNYETVWVSKQHVDFIVNWLINLYNSPLMNIGEVIKAERAYLDCTPLDVEELSKIRRQYTVCIDYMAKYPTAKANNVYAVGGMTPSQGASLVAPLAKNNFIKLEGSDIITTGKFTKAYKQIIKNEM